MASKLLISSSSNNKKANARNMTIGLITLGIGVVVLIAGIVASQNNAFREFDRDMRGILEIIGPLAGILIALCGILVMCANMIFKTSISVYDDHIEGKGMCNKTINTFHLSYDKIRGVSIEKRTGLNIHTDLGVYQVEVESEKVQKIFDLLNK